MFRIPFSFSRLFRLRGRRTAGSDANLRRSSSVPFKSSQPAPPPTQVEPISAPPSSSSARKRPRSLLINPFSGPSPISKSRFTPPLSNVTIQSESIPTIIIGRDTTQQFPAPAPLPPVSGHVGPQIPMNGVSLLSPPQPTSTQANTRIPFQFPATLPRIDDRPESPLSTCSTLIIEIEAQRDAENVLDDRMGPASTVPSIDRERTSASNEESDHSEDVRAASATATGRSDVAKARHASLITPQPVRPDGVHVNRSRFSLPARPRTESPIADPVTRDGTRERRRTSLLSFTSNSRSTTTTKKEGRMTRFSKEFSKPETQEVLRALAWRM
ncbi:hypothetical protein JVU11DRAFT_9577 [Chiua virens]|nr:hypothetical protein JVU11DRAFT_9577 [Chiua virens]